MFTGLVERAGHVVSFSASPAGRRLVVDAGSLAAQIAPGDSVAVNGCCLTAVGIDPAGPIAFDLLVETVRRTSLAAVAPGGRVNLELALRAGDRLGGHFVTGHVDGTAEVVVAEFVGGDGHLRIRPPADGAALLVEKGSISVDGVSLTVGTIGPDGFDVWLIPETLARTNLGDRRAGDRVNLEFDLLAKHVERLLAARLAPRAGAAQG